MQSPQAIVQEVIMAILPIALVVFLLQITIIWLPWVQFLQFGIGLLMVIAGMIFFLIGVQMGMLPIGELVGASLPQTKRLWIVLAVSSVLGFIATIAEPDVRVLSAQVDMVTNGEISDSILVLSVAVGLGFFVAVAILRIVLNIPIKYLLIGSYTCVFALSAVTPPDFYAISFDAGGVTTGPMAVPFILALGVGVASVLRGKTASGDGFGLVALASVGPILSVMILGIIYHG